MPAGESELIAAFLKPFARQVDPAVRVGAGASDCAVVRPSRGLELVLKVDAAVDGVHFDLSKSTPSDAGWKALAMALSDLAAAGARPRWFLCALGVPERGAAALRTASQMARGMSALARRETVALVGGNVTRAREWSLTVTALGEARRAVSRGGGRPGDALVVVGALGDAAVGLELLGAGGSTVRAAPGALRAQLRPVPQSGAAEAVQKYASASVDVSDGFLRDLGHLCRASRCGAEVDVDALPLGRAARAHPRGVELALSGGEDYALVCAVPSRRLAAFRKALPEAHLVGRLASGRKLHLESRRALPRLDRTGFDHLA